MRRQRGFTLTEIAIAFLIMALLLAGFMYTLSAQTDQRNRADTQRRLEDAKELLITFALANGRLPCPARCSNFPMCNAAGDGGDEFFVGAPQTACTDGYAGYLPGRAIGFIPVDANGYALDAWGNRIRYAVAQTINAGTAPHFTNAVNLKANGITTMPTDLVVCASAGAAGMNTGVIPPVCGTVGGVSAAVTNQNMLAAVVWSHGKNYRTLAAMSADETMNNKHRLPAAASNHPVFIWHEVRGTEAGAGELDDQLVWIPAGQLYARLIAAGVLP